MTQAASNAFTSFECDGWRKAAVAYAGAWGRLTTQAIPRLLDAAGVRAGSRVLDVACGPGFAAGAAAERGAVAAGLDFSPEMLEQARRNFANVDFHEGSADRLPFDSRTFDAVMINFGLFHFEHPDRALREAHRVLRDGGRIAFSAWDAPARARLFGIVLESVEKHGRMDVELPTGPGFFNFSDEAPARAALAAAGFEDTAFETVAMSMHLDSPEELFGLMQRASVRTAALLRGQSPAALARIGQAITEGARAHMQDGRVVLPANAHIASGRKP